jgi:hypothetical protein
MSYTNTLIWLNFNRQSQSPILKQMRCPSDFVQITMYIYNLF